MPVTSVSAKVNPRIRRSGAAWINSGLLSDGMSASSPRVNAIATNTPVRPPMADSTRLSTSSWRTSLPRVAPSDSRTAISRWRMKPRAMSRLATLAQEMSSTRPTMHISTIKAVEKSLRRFE